MNETIFVLLITVGIPVLSVTLIIMKSMDNRNRRRSRKEMDQLDESELRDIYYGLKDLNRRIDNLETILYDRKKDQSGSNQ